jgi:tripartite-type tricarboxylate transporter receptor subunit TctC
VLALLVSLAWPAAIGAEGPGEAAELPSRPAVRVLLGYPPGGAGDKLLRAWAPALAWELRQAVVVDNRPGAAGLLALQALTQAPPDGHTLLLADTGVFSAAFQQDPLPPPPLSPIATLGTLPFTLVARSGLSASTAVELIALLRAHPGRYTVATPGAGSVGHQAAERFQQAAGVCLRFVPYKGGSQLLPDLAAGRVDLAFVSLATARVAASVGHAQLLATTSLGRLPEAPAMPSLSETLPGFDVATHVFLLGPEGLLPALVRTIERAALDTLRQPAVAAALAQQGLLVAPAGTDALRAALQQQQRQLRQRQAAKVPPTGDAC